MKNKIEEIKTAPLRLSAIRDAIEERVQPGRRRWRRIVKEYASDLLEDILNEEPEAVTSVADVRALLLNGAGSPSKYSWGGCSIIYTVDIWRRLLPAGWAAKKGNTDTLTKTEAARLVGPLSTYWEAGNDLARNRRCALDIQAAAIADALDVIEYVAFDLAREEA